MSEGRATGGRRTAIVMATIGLAVVVALVVTGLLHRDRVRALLGEQPLPEYHGPGTVTILKGPIPLRDFLQYLSEVSGLPLLRDPRLTDRDIQIAADIHGANAEIAKAILEINGIRVTIETLPDGHKVLKAEPAAAGGEGGAR